MSDPSGVLWIDLETTGLSVRDDVLLEVAVILTKYDRDLDPIAGGSWVVKPSRFGDAVSRMDDHVRDMHTANGLLHECATAGDPPQHVDREIARLMGDGEWVLGGSGVEGFDRAWLPRWLPSVHRRVLLYPHALDMSPIKSMARLAGRLDLLPPVPTKHRAWWDVEWAVSAARLTMYGLVATP